MNLRFWRRKTSEAEICRRALERVQQIVDDEMPSPKERLELLGHLDACTTCGVEAEAVREMKIAIARVGSGTDAEIVQRLRDLADRLPTDGGSR